MLRKNTTVLDEVSLTKYPIDALKIPHSVPSMLMTIKCRSGDIIGQRTCTLDIMKQKLIHQVHSLLTDSIKEKEKRMAFS
jgi:hypothetical protein